MTSATEAGSLHVVTIRSHTAVTAADLKGFASSVHEHMLAPHAHVKVLAPSYSAVSDGCSATVACPRFTVLSSWCGLFVFLRRALVYALGRSGSARRDSLGL